MSKNSLIMVLFISFLSILLIANVVLFIVLSGIVGDDSSELQEPTKEWLVCKKCTDGTYEILGVADKVITNFPDKDGEEQVNIHLTTGEWVTGYAWEYKLQSAWTPALSDAEK